jgi:hypothetical protein
MRRVPRAGADRGAPRPSRRRTSRGAAPLAADAGSLVAYRASPRPSCLRTSHRAAPLAADAGSLRRMSRVAAPPLRRSGSRGPRRAHAALRGRVSRARPRRAEVEGDQDVVDIPALAEEQVAQEAPRRRICKRGYIWRAGALCLSPPRVALHALRPAPAASPLARARLRCRAGGRAYRRQVP